MRKPIVVYGSITLFIALWWSVAFILFAGRGADGAPTGAVVNSRKDNLSSPHLSRLKRDKIEKALAGDTSLMIRLIVKWEMDADILIERGFSGIKKLPRAQLIQALTAAKEAKKKRFRHPSSKRFLPQTFIAASFLLAIVEPRQIAALPKGFREQRPFCPKAIADQIALDIDRFNSEKIFQARPDMAFAANYSHPAALQALKNQRIPLFIENAPLSMSDIVETARRYGEITEMPEKATLLATFIEAAMLTIDNRLRTNQKTCSLSKILFLHHYSHFCSPTKKHISGQLVDRLREQNINFVDLSSREDNEWLIPVNSEQIANSDPDLLIISTMGAKKLPPAYLSFLPAARSKVVFIDDNFQTPNQYVVLAYYDLARSLISYE